MLLLVLINGSVQIRPAKSATQFQEMELKLNNDLVCYTVSVDELHGF